MNVPTPAFTLGAWGTLCPCSHDGPCCTFYVVFSALGHCLFIPWISAFHLFPMYLSDSLVLLAADVSSGGHRVILLSDTL